MKKIYNLAMSAICLISVNLAYAQNPPWIELTSGVSSMLLSVCFTDPNHGYTVGYYGVALKTIDGTTWNAMTVPTSTHLNAVYFVDANTGFIAGDYGEIYKTTDAGATWIQKPSGTQAWLCSISHSNDGIYMVGYSGTMLKSTDNGETWGSIIVPVSVDLLSVSFCPQSSEGWAVGRNGTIIHSIDGLTWTIQLSGTTVDLYGVYFPLCYHGYATGFNSTILTYNNSLWTAGSGVPQGVDILTSTFNRNHPYYHLAAGKDGLILISKDDGLNWSDYSPNPLIFTWWRSITMANTQTGFVAYAVGDDGKIIKLAYVGTGFPNEIVNEENMARIFPNPCTASTTISYYANKKGYVHLETYSFTGQLQEILIDQIQEQGEYQIDIGTSTYADGLYYFKLEMDSRINTGRFVISR